MHQCIFVRVILVCFNIFLLFETNDHFIRNLLTGIAITDLEMKIVQKQERVERYS